MAILSDTGRIYMVREPICGRFGIHRLLAMLSSGALNVRWNGIDEITVISFNKKRSLCKLLHIDEYGVDCTSRILNTGIFQVVFSDNSIPVHLTREELENILKHGSIPDRFNHTKAA